MGLIEEREPFGLLRNGHFNPGGPLGMEGFCSSLLRRGQRTDPEAGDKLKSQVTDHENETSLGQLLPDRGEILPNLASLKLYLSSSSPHGLRHSALVNVAHIDGFEHERFLSKNISSFG